MFSTYRVILRAHKSYLTPTSGSLLCDLNKLINDRFVYVLEEFMKALGNNCVTDSPPRGLCDTTSASKVTVDCHSVSVTE